MTAHPLDRAVWSALETRHARFAEGGDRARRYAPGLIPFAASRDDAPESLDALAGLARAGEQIYFLQADPIVLPPTLSTVMTADAVQMVADRSLPDVDASAPMLELDASDAADMVDLATLTKPGPISPRSIELGGFVGIRVDGRLVAMAGERMALDGFSEISGVCAHPDARGKGFGRLLSIVVARRILARGDTPFLHAYASNGPAISLYRSIGFSIRCPVHVAVAVRA